MSVLLLCTYPGAAAKVRVRYEQKDAFGEYDELSLCRAEVVPQFKMSSSTFCSRVYLFCAPKCSLA